MKAEVNDWVEVKIIRHISLKQPYVLPMKFFGQVVAKSTGDSTITNYLITCPKNLHTHNLAIKMSLSGFRNYQESLADIYQEEIIRIL